jgi:hypothetical protein
VHAGVAVTNLSSGEPEPESESGSLS